MGVKKIDNVEVMDVKVMDSSTLAFASELMKLEILPPGQEATSIIPRATEGCGFSMRIRANVKSGRRSSCASNPSRSLFGVASTFLNLSNDRSKAIPNIMNAKVTLMRTIPDLLKLSTISSTRYYSWCQI